MKFKIFIAVVLGLVVLRMALPSILLRQINHSLKDLGEYTGSVEDLDLSLYRGAYQLQGIDLKKKGAEKSLLYIEELDVGISWRGLFNGKILSTVYVFKPIVRYQTSADEKKAQTSNEEVNQRTLSFLFPIEINSFTVRQGRLEWLDIDLSANEGVHFSEIDIDAFSLRLEAEDSAGGPFWLKAKFMGEFPLEASGKLNLMNTPVSFDVDGMLPEFDMTRLNPMLKKYVPIDITKGKLIVAAEAAQKGEKLIGYLTVGLKEGDVIATNQNFSSAKHFLFEILGAIGNFFLQNWSSETLVATFPIQRTEGAISVNTDNILKKVWDGKKKGEVELEKSISFDQLQSTSK